MKLNSFTAQTSEFQKKLKPEEEFSWSSSILIQIKVSLFLLFTHKQFVKQKWKNFKIKNMQLFRLRFFFLSLYLYVYPVYILAICDLYISSMTFSIDILPIVFLKKSSSIVCDETDLSAGSNSNSLPNRNGWPGYAVAMYLLNVSWVWSWNANMLWMSLR